MVVNQWQKGETISAEKEITVMFEEDESGKKQADGFNGLIVSGLSY